MMQQESKKERGEKIQGNSKIAILYMIMGQYIGVL